MERQYQPVPRCPLVGSGAGTFVDAYPAWQTAITRGLVVDHAHNDYVEFVTDTGIVGLLLTGWFWFAFFRKVIPAWRQRRSHTSRLLSAGAMAGIVSILLYSFTDFNLEIPANALYLFLLCALFVAASYATQQRGRQGTLLPKLADDSRNKLFALALVVVLCGAVYGVAAEIGRLSFVSVASLDLATASDANLELIGNTAKRSEMLAPLSPVYSFAQGLVLGKKGEAEASLVPYQRTLWRRPLHVEYYLQVARTLFAMKDTARAEQMLVNALRIDPANEVTRRELANFYLVSDRRQEGMKVLREGLALNPLKTPEVLRLLTLSGIPRTAFFDAMPQRSRSWALLGDFFRQLNQKEETERAYRHAVEALQVEDPPDSFIIWRYLDLLIRAKWNAEGLALIKTALNVFPDNPYFLARQGLLYERENLRDRAIESYRASILIDPRHEWVRKRLQNLEKGLK